MKILFLSLLVLLAACDSRATQYCKEHLFDNGVTTHNKPAMYRLLHKNCVKAYRKG